MPYVIMNLTDGIPAGYQEWDTHEEAEDCIKRMRDTFQTVQGYYRTNTGERISPYQVEYEIIEIESTENEE